MTNAELVTYLRDLADEFEKVVDAEGNDWMLFVYDRKPPWFVADSDLGAWDSADDYGQFVEAVAMLRGAADALEARDD